MKNSKDFQEALVTNQKVLVEAIKFVKGLNKSQLTEKQMINQYENCFHDINTKIKVEMRVKVSDLNREIKALVNLLDAWEDVKTLTGYESLVSDAHRKINELEEDAKVLESILSEEVRWADFRN